MKGLGDSPVYQNLMKASVNEIGNKHTVVSTDGLYSLTVHLVVGVWFGKEEPCIPFLVDQQIWKVNLHR